MYSVYQEGIYLGYRYFETRYEDVVMGTAKAGDYNWAVSYTHLGFGAAEKIRAVDADAVLVFVTNMAQYAIKGYEVDGLD